MDFFTAVCLTLAVSIYSFGSKRRFFLKSAYPGMAYLVKPKKTKSNKKADCFWQSATCLYMVYESRSEYRYGLSLLRADGVYDTVSHVNEMVGNTLKT